MEVSGGGGTGTLNPGLFFLRGEENLDFGAALSATTKSLRFPSESAHHQNIQVRLGWLFLWKKEIIYIITIILLFIISTSFFFFSITASTSTFFIHHQVLP